MPVFSAVRLGAAHLHRLAVDLRIIFGHLRRSPVSPPQSNASSCRHQPYGRCVVSLSDWYMRVPVGLASSVLVCVPVISVCIAGVKMTGYVSLTPVLGWIWLELCASAFGPEEAQQVPDASGALSAQLLLQAIRGCPRSGSRAA